MISTRIRTDMLLLCCTAVSPCYYELKLKHKIQQGCSKLASLLSDPDCSLRVLVINKCELGFAGVISILQALSKNCSLEEINLAGNVDPSEIQSLTDSFELVQESSNYLQKDIMAEKNTKSNELEVADSEDDIAEAEATTVPGVEDSKVGTSQKSTLSECESMQQLSAAIKLAGNLKLVDLSGNGFSVEVVEMLFSGWSSGGRAGVAQRHVDGKVVHFLVQGTKCCGSKSCCRKI